MGHGAGSQLGGLVVESQALPHAETIPVGVAQIKAPVAWDCSRGKGVKVAVLDTGIDNTHPDLAANYKGGVSSFPEKGPWMATDRGLIWQVPLQPRSMGCVVGVAPAASLHAVKALANSGSGQWSRPIAGIDWCISNKMHILSMGSGGGSAPGALEMMCNTAFNKGALVGCGRWSRRTRHGDGWCSWQVQECYCRLCH